MDLRQLKTFVHVAELGSLSKAADRLHVAQPALSRQIRLLEAELNASLFVRHGRGMVLTASGQVLLARATSVLRELEAARADVLAGTLQVTGRVVLGTPPTVGDALSARLVRQFRGQYPDVALRIVPGFSGYLQDWLLRGEIDLAVMYDLQAPRHVKTEPLIREKLFFVGPAQRAATANTITLAKALDRQLILPGPQHGLRKLIDQAAQRVNRSPVVHVEADSLQILKDLVAFGLGHTILPLASIHPDIKEGRLTATLISSPQLTRTLVLAEATARQLSRAAQLFRDALVEEVAAMVSAKIWTGTLLYRR